MQASANRQIIRFNFEDLLPELQLLIAGMMRTSDFVHFYSSSKALHSRFAGNQLLWEGFCKLDFTAAPWLESPETFLQFYKERHKDKHRFGVNKDKDPLIPLQQKWRYMIESGQDQPAREMAHELPIEKLSDEYLKTLISVYPKDLPLTAQVLLKKIEECPPERRTQLLAFWAIVPIKRATYFTRKFRLIADAGTYISVLNQIPMDEVISAFREKFERLKDASLSFVRINLLLHYSHIFSDFRIIEFFLKDYPNRDEYIEATLYYAILFQKLVFDNPHEDQTFGSDKLAISVKQLFSLLSEKRRQAFVERMVNLSENAINEAGCIDHERIRGQNILPAFLGTYVDLNVFPLTNNRIVNQLWYVFALHYPLNKLTELTNERFNARMKHTEYVAAALAAIAQIDPEKIKLLHKEHNRNISFNTLGYLLSFPHTFEVNEAIKFYLTQVTSPVNLLHLSDSHRGRDLRELETAMALVPDYSWDRLIEFLLQNFGYDLSLVTGEARNRLDAPSAYPRNEAALLTLLLRLLDEPDFKSKISNVLHVQPFVSPKTFIFFWGECIKKNKFEELKDKFIGYCCNGFVYSEYWDLTSLSNVLWRNSIYVNANFILAAIQHDAKHDTHVFSTMWKQMKNNSDIFIATIMLNMPHGSKELDIFCAEVSKRQTINLILRFAFLMVTFDGVPFGDNFFRNTKEIYTYRFKMLCERWTTETFKPSSWMFYSEYLKDGFYEAKKYDLGLNGVFITGDEFRDLNKLKQCLTEYAALRNSSASEGEKNRFLDLRVKVKDYLVSYARSESKEGNHDHAIAVLQLAHDHPLIATHQFFGKQALNVTVDTALKFFHMIKKTEHQPTFVSYSETQREIAVEIERIIAERSNRAVVGLGK